MIIYGMRAAHLKSATAQGVTCPHCNTLNSTMMSVFGRHAHIFWIPLFPLGKTGGAQCQQCQTTFKKKEMPADLKQAYGYLASEARPKIWQFAGLMLIGAFIAWGAYSSGQEQKRYTAYASTPVAGDVYEYKQANNRYSNWKIVSVTQDSVRVLHNDYEVDKATGLYDLRGEENYSDFYESLPRTKLAEMLENGTIIDIDRIGE